MATEFWGVSMRAVLLSDGDAVVTSPRVHTDTDGGGLGDGQVNPIVRPVRLARRIANRFSLIVLFVGVLLTVALIGVASASAAVTPHPLVGALDATSGAGNTAWIAYPDGSSFGLARVDASGLVTQRFPLPDFIYHGALTTDSSGDVWYIACPSSTLGDSCQPVRVSHVDGTLRRYSDPAFHPELGSRLWDIAQGLDGRMWITLAVPCFACPGSVNDENRSILKLDPASGAVENGASISARQLVSQGGLVYLGSSDASVTEMGGPTERVIAARPAVGLTFAPDGDLWFQDSDTRQLVRVTPAGAVSAMGELSRSFLDRQLSASANKVVAPARPSVPADQNGYSGSLGATVGFFDTAGNFQGVVCLSDPTIPSPFSTIIGTITALAGTTLVTTQGEVWTIDDGTPLQKSCDISTSGPGGGPTPSRGIKLTAPGSVKRAATLRNGLRISVRCTAACTISASLRYRPRHARRASLVARGNASRNRAGTTRLTLRFTAAGKKSLAPSRDARVMLRLTVRQHGVRKTFARSVTLR